MPIVEWDPATIVEIKVGELSAPVAVGAEMSKMSLVIDQIIRRLAEDIEPDPETGKLIVPHDLLPWVKEYRMLLSEIHKLTGEVEQKAQMRKMELQAKLFAEYFKDLPQQEKIKIMKELKGKKQDDNSRPQLAE